jgi:hypothetical protein
MSAAFDLGRDIPESREALSPQVFSRGFSVPAGAPWEQARAAQLEVRHGSPLPISELSWRLRRLGGWGPGRPGRYVVFYVRNREFAEPFETTVAVEGELHRVSFGSAGEQLRRARRMAVLGVLVGALVVALGAGLVAGLNARARAASQLETLERLADLKTRQAGKLQLRLAQERELQTAVGAAGTLDDVISDLTWASAAKAPDARIAAFHWDHGLLAVESRGEASPFLPSDRQVERVARPIRPGIWLWAARSRVAPPPPPPPVTTP